MLPIKSGFKTSEFYLSAASSIVGILVYLGYLSPVQADQFSKALAGTMGGIMTMVSIAVYVYGRVTLKKAAMTGGRNQPATTPSSTVDQVDTATPAVYPQ